uniref:Uncharacterized protein n=1 Tax=Caenorhabditis tropicalis TaxID=1561998 RepID=A0A1I7TID8_9PELO
MIIPGALAALGYLVFVIALAVFMSLVCSMFGVAARTPPQAQRLVSTNHSSVTQGVTNTSLQTYNTNP